MDWEEIAYCVGIDFIRESRTPNGRALLPVQKLDVASMNFYTGYSMGMALSGRVPLETGTLASSSSPARPVMHSGGCTGA